ncbi:MAG: hypothetical protein LUQ09_01795 [Methanomassiliicoccales archaeon]|nr:hypothetical protein [Methanomassiliicoccales archaeon]
MKFKVERICCYDSMSAMPMDRTRLDLKASEMRLREAGFEVEPQDLYLTVNIDEMDVTIYPGGRVLIHPMNDKAKAKELAQKIFDLLVKEGS